MKSKVIIAFIALMVANASASAQTSLALKASLALAPESQKAKYEVKGNKVIVVDDKDRDTLTLSNDGKTLSGIFDKNTKYTLKRTK